MSHKIRIRIAAVVTVAFLAGLSAAGLAVRTDHPHSPPQAAAAVQAHGGESHGGDD